MSVTTLAVMIGPGHLGTRLRHLRKAGGLSQRDLDRLAGTSECYASRIEKGTRETGTAVARAYAGVLGCSLDYLLSGRGDEPSEAEIRAAIEACKRRRNGKRKRSGSRA